MSFDILNSLFEAAYRLDFLGRQESARAILVNVLEKNGTNSLQHGFSQMAQAGQTSLALLCLDILAGHGPLKQETWLETCWLELEKAGAGQPVEPDLVRSRLRHLTPERLQIGAATNRPDLCYVLSISLPQDTTGYAMRTQSLVSAFEAHGLSPHCLTIPGFPWHRGYLGQRATEQVGSVTYHRCGGAEHSIPEDFASFRAAGAELVMQLKQIRPKAVMAASNYQAAIPALLAARRLSLPFIYDVRGFWEYSRAANDPHWGRSKAFGTTFQLETLAATQSELVLTLTGAMRDELVYRGVESERICLVPNAADPERFVPRPRSSTLARKLQILDAVPVIGYIGSFNGYEGLDDLLQACIGLARGGQSFRLLLVGSDHGPHSPRLNALRDQAEAAGIAELVILPGKVPADEVADWYSLIDIAPIPRKSVRVTELVSPLKPLEAMAMEKALVVSNLPPLVEIAKHEQTGLVYANDEEDGLMLTLSRLLQDQNLRQRLGYNARKWVSNERNWGTVTEEAARKLKELIVAGTR